MPEPAYKTERHVYGRVVLQFTPSEWRTILEDPTFLSDEDNDYHAPRRLLGLPVQIVPDHRFG